MNRHRLWIDGRWEESPRAQEVRSPFSGEVVAQACQADAAQMERAIAAAATAFHASRSLSSWARSRLCAGIASRLASRRSELVSRIIEEAGKPRGQADAEVSRAIMTFTLASEEAKRLGGEVLPVDLDAGARAFARAVCYWVPRGPVLAIGPFNFPLNLLAHKVAPALASGCSVVLKPPPQAPGAAGMLAEIFEAVAAEMSDARETIHPALLQLVQGPNDVIGLGVRDPRLATLSFTGSDKVGWLLQSQAARKKVCLELGGNAAVIIHADADLARAAARCAYGAYAYAGQICISVQRILVERSVAPRFQDALLAEIAKLGVGDPAREGTIVGPMIDEANADRVLQWVGEATQAGARMLCGGSREGNVVAPILLTGTKADQRVNRDEIFGPVATLESYGTVDEAIAAVNASRFGLQAGVFSDSHRVIRDVCERVDAGGIIVNEIPTFRADNMPYGGVKDSGLGREGVRYSMEELCERKVVVDWRG